MKLYKIMNIYKIISYLNYSKIQLKNLKYIYIYIERKNKNIIQIIYLINQSIFEFY